MNFLKSVFMAVIVTTLTLGFGTCAMLLSPFDRSGNLVHWFARWWARTLLWTGRIPVRIDGLANVPFDRPCILASNHASAADIPILFGHLPFQFRVIAKDSLFRIPVLGWCMRLAGYIGIDRGSPTKAMRSLRRAAGRLQSGLPVLVFPEGTRSRTGELLPFHNGAFLLAIEAGVPVVPIGIRGSYEILVSGSMGIRPGIDVSICVGPAIETANYSRKERGELALKVQEAVRRCLDSDVP